MSPPSGSLIRLKRLCLARYAPCKEAGSSLECRVRLLIVYAVMLCLQFLLTCCNTVPGSCTSLKQTYPTLADGDNSTNPNFCYIHGNVCTR